MLTLYQTNRRQKAIVETKKSVYVSDKIKQLSEQLNGLM